MDERHVAHKVSLLPVDSKLINTDMFLNELIDSTASLSVYIEKINDSKLNKSWFLPTLQQKEALASSMLEGTQATLDGVLIDQIIPDEKNYNFNEVRNYDSAALAGYKYLTSGDFDKDFIFLLHKKLMTGRVRKQSNDIGVFRTKQNYIGRTGDTHEITYTPPIYEEVPGLIDNLLSYVKSPKDSFRPLIRAAIIHAQFETIHPFDDGNGRVGRILIPLYLFHTGQLDLPCFFISEILEKDKMKYYSLLNNIRYKKQWSEWIKYFLEAVTKQCKKYIKIINQINTLYEQHLEVACTMVRSSKMVDLINLLYKFPVINSNTVSEFTDIPIATINRYLNLLVEANILYSNNKSRKRTYFYYDLLDIIR